MPSSSRNAIPNATKNDHLVASVAMLYYNEGLTQKEIAERYGISRATVINYLREGRKRGIVDIQIQGQAFASSSLSHEICERFGLQAAYVAQTFLKKKSGSALAENTRQTARVAAMAICDMIQPNFRIGISWGQTVKLIVDSAPKLNAAGVSVHQMVGSINSKRAFSGETCAHELASRIGASCFTLHAPALLSSSDLAEKLREENSIRRQLRQFQLLDLAFFTAGNLKQDRHMVVANEFGISDELESAKRKGAVALICGRFINKAGKTLQTEITDRVIAIDHETLKRVPARVLVASGDDKLTCVSAAIAGGFATHLVVDEPLANSLLNS